MDNTEKYHALRAQYPEFEYVDYHYKSMDEGLRLWFDFRMGDVEFHPWAVVEQRSFLHMEGGEIDRMVFDIGMAELVSYWKCACPPKVRVLCGSLTDSQISFWKKLYWHGLGEYFYTNGIEETSEAYMEIAAQRPDAGACIPVAGQRDMSEAGREYLVPIGGGKDSVVTLELLRRAGKRVRPLIMNPRGATRECARVAGFGMDEVLVIRRTIDPVLLELNSRGYLNGHTPFSAMLAFYTRLSSALSGIPNVALSNESSANESTVIGSSVNHQYSKSLEFENDFREYCADETALDCIRVGTSATGTLTHSHTGAFNYFSFLRPLSELQIAMLFSREKQYHDVFRSCNVGSKQDIWCGHCAKCLFAYVILSPFIAPERLEAIFGKNMLDDATMRGELDQLMGMSATKPFECVGTVDEVRQALAMSMQRWYEDGRPALLKEMPLPPDHWMELSRAGAAANLNGEEYSILTQALAETCTVKND